MLRGGKEKEMTQGKLIDITQTLSYATPVIAGDAPLEIRLTSDTKKGECANVSSLTLSPHLGTHMDAPLHLFDKGGDVLTISLEACAGEAVVVDLSDADTLEPVTMAELGSLPQDVKRVLSKTRKSPLLSVDEPYRPISPEAVRALAQRGVVLLGTDTFGVDPLISTSLEGHHAALGAGMILLENLLLKPVSAGRYELLAFPLKIAGLEASPVRATVRKLSST